jgi:hypothetical protein
MVSDAPQRSTLTFGAVRNTDGAVALGTLNRGEHENI